MFWWLFDHNPPACYAFSLRVSQHYMVLEMDKRTDPATRSAVDEPSPVLVFGQFTWSCTFTVGEMGDTSNACDDADLAETYAPSAILAGEPVIIVEILTRCHVGNNIVHLLLYQSFETDRYLGTLRFRTYSIPAFGKLQHLAALIRC